MKKLLIVRNNIEPIILLQDLKPDDTIVVEHNGKIIGLVITSLSLRDIIFTTGSKSPAYSTLGEIMTEYPNFNFYKIEL